MAEQQGQAATPAATAPQADADPVASIRAILDSESAPEKESAAEERQQPESPDDAEADAPANDGEQETPEEPAVEGDDAPDTMEMAEIPLDQLEAIALEVKVKGEDGKDIVEKPTIKELREGYMRQKDYSRKTAEVARQREEVPEKIRQGVESERTSYLQTLQELQSVVIETVAPELKNVDWNTLSTTDPFEYIRLKNRSEQIQQVLTGIQTKQQEIVNKQKAERAQTLQKVAQESRQMLEEKIPGWNDDLYQSLMETASKDYGYKREEVASWVDPKAFQLLHDAHQFRQLKATKPIVDKRVVSVPKVVKPGSSQPVSRKQSEASEAMKRLKGSGKIEDAAAVIRSRLG